MLLLLLMRILIFVLGGCLVLYTLGSAIRTFVLPRSPFIVRRAHRTRG